jgi:hypothetical protein
MAYWFMTGDWGTLRELHRRATLDPYRLCSATPDELQAIKASAAWMVQSVRGQYPDFDEAMREQETRSKVPVIAEDPTEGPTPAGAA